MALFSKLFLITAILFSFAACTKNNNDTIADVKYTGPKMVAFNNYDGYQEKTIPIKDSFVSIEYEVKLSNTTKTAEAPITVKLIKDDNAIYEYNTINGTEYNPLPLSSYKFDQTDVVIPKGARSAKVVFEVNAAKILTISQPAFGISIYSVSGDGATIINDKVQTHLVVQVIALNKYDGIYRVKGYGYLGATNTTAPYTFNIPCGDPNEVSLASSGPNSVKMDHQPLWRNGVFPGFSNILPELTFSSSTDAVTNVSGYGASTAFSFPNPNTSGYNSRYETGTKIIYVSYGIALNSSWYVVDTLIYCRPR